MRTLKNRFWTALSGAHTSIPPVLPKQGAQAIGRLRGGLSTKVHTKAEASVNPLRLVLSAVQIADIDFATD